MPVGRSPDPSYDPPDIPKTLHNTDGDGAEKNVPDIVKWGNPDQWQLLCKASSEKEGWMKSTKAMMIEGIGCLVQVTTQQRNPDGSYCVAEAVTFVSGVCIAEALGIPVQSRGLVAIGSD